MSNPKMSNAVLKGYKVIDLGSFITAPYACMLLAEMGAEVIKVEKPKLGDPFRLFNGTLYSSAFQAHNRNKKSLELDFTKPQGLKILDKIIANADALVINVRPGVEKKLGIDFERLHAINPKLVYCLVTGYGAEGPYAERPAYDNVGQVLSGWLSLFHGGEDSRVAGPAVSDTVTGIFAAMGILAALLERSTTGVGRKVEVSMLESMIALSTEPLAKLFALGQPIELHSRAKASQAFIFTCKDGKRIGIHLSSPEKFWSGLIQALNAPHIAEQFPTHLSRVQRSDQLSHELALIFKQQDRDHWLPLLEAHDVPFAPERLLHELEEDPQVQHLKTFYTVSQKKYGSVKAAHRAVRFDGDNTSDFFPPPDLGEHNFEIFKSLGLSEDELRSLESADIIGSIDHKG